MKSAPRSTAPLTALWLLALGRLAVAGTPQAEDAPAPAEVVAPPPAPEPAPARGLESAPASAPASAPPGPIAAASAPSVRELEPGAPPLANQRYRAGIEMYTRADFAGAAREFTVGLALAPTSAKLAYNLARSLERAGNVSGAVETYRRYLALSPAAADRAAVLQIIEVLEREGRAPPAPSAPPPEVNASVAAPSTPAESTLTGREVALWSTVAGGAVAVIVGALFAFRAADARGEADGLSAADVDRHDRLEGDFDSAAVGAGLGFGFAGALGLAAAALAFWPSSADSESVTGNPRANTGNSRAVTGSPRGGVPVLGFSF